MPAETGAQLSERRARLPRNQRLLAKLLNLYPPFLGAGVRVARLEQSDGGFAVRMRLTFWNRNLVGTQFGGSLYSMCDPFFMLILFEKLGPGYVVWDKAATIRFRRPGRGTVSAMFSISAERVEEIRALAGRGETVEPTFTAEVRDESGQVVAEVEKLLYVRRQENADLPASRHELDPPRGPAGRAEAEP